MMQQADGGAERVSLTLSRTELSRARERVRMEEWRPAAEALRRKADAALADDRPLPEFDSAWYDADPDRPYAETYDAFHAYASGGYGLMPGVRTLLRAGLVFEDDRCLDRAKALMLHVADRMAFHVRHYDAGLSYGRVGDVMADLDVALGDRLSDDERDRLRRAMVACTEAILASNRQWLTDPVLTRMPYNNHLPRQLGAVMAAGLALGRREWVDRALSGERGFGELLAGAAMDDGLCYESSTLYHYATAGALMGIAELCRHRPDVGRDLYREAFANGRCLKQMLDAPLGLLLPNGELPCLGDCYARRQALWSTHAGCYEVAFAVYDDPRYAWLVAQGGERSSAEALLYGADRLEPAEPPLARSRIWVEHGYALLTSRAGRSYWDGQAVAAVMTGDRSGIHGHRDALSLQVFAAGRLWTEDAESDAVEIHGFSAPIQKAFNRTMLAHNLVAVDEQDQQHLDRTVRVTEFKELPACRTVAMADADGRAVPGVRMTRCVAVTPGYCLDVFQAVSDEEHTYDWQVHPRADGPATCPLDLSPTGLPDREPYAVLRNAVAGEFGSEGVCLGWSQTGETFRLAVSAGLPGRLIRAEWPVRSDGSAGGREMFIFRVRAARADFVALYQLEGHGTPWRVACAERVFNGEDDEVRVGVTNGTETRRHVFGGL